MKRIILFLSMMFPFMASAQAHLGESITGLRQRYPGKEFKFEVTNEGVVYVMAEQTLGYFAYFFDQETGLTYMCMQIPYNMQALNAQVEIYNKKYVIVSETSWKAYLEGGGIMKINLNYNEEKGSYLFIYTQ